MVVAATGRAVGAERLRKADGLPVTADILVVDVRSVAARAERSMNEPPARGIPSAIPPAA